MQDGQRLLDDRGLLERLCHRRGEAGERLELLVAALGRTACAALLDDGSPVIDDQVGLAREGREHHEREGATEPDQWPGAGAVGGDREGEHDREGQHLRARKARARDEPAPFGLGVGVADVADLSRRALADGGSGQEPRADRDEGRRGFVGRGDPACFGDGGQRVGREEQERRRGEPAGDPAVLLAAAGGDEDAGQDEADEVQHDDCAVNRVAVGDARHDREVDRGRDDEHEQLGDLEDAVRARVLEPRPQMRPEAHDQSDRGDGTDVHRRLQGASGDREDDRHADREGCHGGAEGVSAPRLGRLVLALGGAGAQH